MSKSRVSDIRKRPPGRPRVDAVPVMVRIPPDDVARLDNWIAKQNEPLSRPEALRAMMAMVLKGKPKG